MYIVTYANIFIVSQSLPVWWSRQNDIGASKAMYCCHTFGQACLYLSRKKKKMWWKWNNCIRNYMHIPCHIFTLFIWLFHDKVESIVIIVMLCFSVFVFLSSVTSFFIYPSSAFWPQHVLLSMYIYIFNYLCYVSRSLVFDSETFSFIAMTCRWNWLQ